jgi:hypothetical protein
MAQKGSTASAARSSDFFIFPYGGINRIKL